MAIGLRNIGGDKLTAFRLEVNAMAIEASALRTRSRASNTDLLGKPRQTGAERALHFYHACFNTLKKPLCMLCKSFRSPTILHL